jgi:hypothetical protein
VLGAEPRTPLDVAVRETLVGQGSLSSDKLANNSDAATGERLVRLLA